LNKIFIFIGSSLSFMSYQILSITGYFTACCALHKLSQRGVYSQALCTDRDAAAHADFNTAFRQRAWRVCWRSGRLCKAFRSASSFIRL